ncbi:hypothetical protein [Baekduia alba]|uniref:hypothetical protein n=1 Tax=Baekduia alba TaxID=2997333 RepID=UPI002342773E|nr:hypothetical protein [Baekduia alba]
MDKTIGPTPGCALRRGWGVAGRRADVAGFTSRRRGTRWAMDGQRDDEQEPDASEAAVLALVEAQLEAARAGVFRAYVRSRAQARDLVSEDRDDEASRQRRAS